MVTADAELDTLMLFMNNSHFTVPAVAPVLKYPFCVTRRILPTVSELAGSVAVAPLGTFV
jgi:hypothetical protein